jgi:carboxyl-terminal processing protease
LAFGLPVVVLVDGKSASAAEIVAAALQDRDRAVVIGTSSFGKGSVQTVLRLPNDGEITLTWSRLVAPSGYIFHGLGVRPAICTSNAKDGGHDKAMEIIRQVLINRSKTQDTLVAWRTPGLQNESIRARLRDSCPSQPRGNGLEARIANHLINDPTLFARVLNLTADTHQARY